VINEGIDRLAKLVPGPEKNKGAILGRVHLFIESCKDKDVKFDSERQLLRVTVDELTKRNETLRQSARQAWNESNKWQERCRNLGGDFDDYDSHGPHFDESADVDPVG
jgi:FtsZ-binding cell division protein ZapB